MNDDNPKILPMNPRLFRLEPPKPTRHVPRPIKTEFSLGEELFDELMLRLEEKKNENLRLFAKVRHPKSGWINREPKERLKFTNLTKTVLNELITKAFWASLEKDEGRPVTFSVVYRCETKPDELPGGIYPIDLVFKTSTSYTVKTLTELASAIGEQCSIIVTSKRNSLVIVGIALHELGDLRIKILDPGKVIVEYDHENMCLISGSDAVFFRTGLYVHTADIWERLFPNKEGKYLAFSDPRTRVVTNALREMRRIGHGGTLVVIPASQRASQQGIDHIGYQSRDDFTYGSDTITSVREKMEINPSAGQSEIDFFAKKLARLTAVDGATLITTNLDIIGFGCMFKTPSRTTQNPTIYRIDPLHHEGWFESVSLTALGHARHRSAARFIMARKKAVAFVVSQDGGITAILWHPKDEKSAEYLTVISRLDLTLF